jgi:1,4-alpha-glucan branching enzyme
MTRLAADERIAAIKRQIKACLANLLAGDPYLRPYRAAVARRLTKIVTTEYRLTRHKISLADFAAGHEYFGLHFRNGEWVFREWAPNATRIYLVGEFSAWRENEAYALERCTSDGNWEIRLPFDRLQHGDLYRLRMHWNAGAGDRIPAYARRVVQDWNTRIFNAQVWHPETPYRWQCESFRRPDDAPLIYEAHVGMAQPEAKIGSYLEFRDRVLPRIVTAGYNTLQLMALQEHPYYGSFGYQVSNFFAASSRFGTPDELKALIDAAHAAGLSVIMDLIHSHAVSNEVEGMGRFDGTQYQYFHEGPRGRHSAWDSRCFNYVKPQVLHFLLSNCRFWLDEYRLDGFRFDGVTSMLYLDHGLGRAFTSYDDYFNENVDEDALVYLALANKVLHQLRPDAVSIAEDVSGMPGLAVPDSGGGCGFDYRFAMGVPDLWIKVIKEMPDEHWPIGHLWHELTNRRADEKTISYAESHDQALVGDQTLIFRLIGADMYEHMQVSDTSLQVDRGIALHKMIRLLTLATAGHGYLNFMGNEFGHPEWIDFPREGNNWSLHYARRQWYLVDNENLKYRYLAGFDRDMIALTRGSRFLEASRMRQLYEHSDNKLIMFARAGCLFVFNFHPERSYTDFRINAPAGSFDLALDSDAPEYGGHGRLTPHQRHFTMPWRDNPDEAFLSLYLPARSAQVLVRSENSP